MRLRSDGIETRKRILTAASQAFAEEGYRDATVAEIYRRAKSNPASINYDFKDKRPLRDYLRPLLRELLGRKPTARELDCCEMTVLGPWLLVQLSAQQHRAGATSLNRNVAIQSSADHCARFALAGLKAVGGKRQTRGTLKRDHD